MHDSINLFAKTVQRENVLEKLKEEGKIKVIKGQDSDAENVS